MSSYLRSLRIRYGETINKFYRVYGRFKLFHELDRLPCLTDDSSAQTSLSASQNKTVCLILGSKKTSSQFLLTSYLWKKYLQHSGISIKLVSDGNLPQKVINKARKLLGDSTQVINARELLPQKVVTNGENDVKFDQFCQNHRFGRKFLAIYHFSQENNVIYSDDDILLFRKPDQILKLLEQDVKFAYSPDMSGCQCPFHDEMISYASTLGTDPLWDFQAGLLYVKKGTLERSIVNRYLFPWTIDNDAYFSEQTLFSLIFSHIQGGVCLPSEQYVQNAAKGRFSWESDLDYFKDKHIILRHFMGTVRHRYFEVAPKIISKM